MGLKPVLTTKSWLNIMIETHANSAYNYPLLIKHLWHTPLLRCPDQEIVSGLSKRFNYRSIYQRIGKLAAGLLAQGVTRGSTVAVMDWDNHRYFECFFAVPMMGAVLHTINIRLSPEQILYTINHAEDDVILVHADFLPIINQISDRFERPIKLIFLTDKPADQLPNNCSIEFEAMLELVSEAFKFEDFDENTIATTFYTTGTTGDPKGVFYSHRQLVLHTLGLIATMGSGDTNNRFHTGDVYMPITPMFHVHAWGFPYAATLMGIKQVYPGRYEPARLLKLLEKEQVTFSHCVPTILNMLLSAPEAESTQLDGWKVIIGGSALTKGLVIAAAQKGISAFTAYGMSETCPVVSSSNMTDINDHQDDDIALEARCKTGVPAVMVDLRVVDADMNDIPTGGEVTGEVVVRAPWLTQGYTGSPEKSEELWQGGYLHTGDVGYIDDTGSLRITDRIKDVIKSGGEWISSIQLEDIVSRCEGVAEVAAFGIPDERWGERPMLVVVKSTEDLNADTIKTAISEEVDSGVLSRWAIPERIEFVDAIPKTSVGKLDKKVMRKTYG
ncbi:MAG: fatty-acyl-CoA synthase [Gammaproteobacteria bacterium]|jgi:fatty-acyl-CoA synthase